MNFLSVNFISGIFAGILAGLGLGFVLYVFYRRSVGSAEKNLRDAFQSLAGQALQANSDDFVKRTREQMENAIKRIESGWGVQKAEFTNLADPLKNSLSELETHVKELEMKREEAYGRLNQQLSSLMNATQDITNVLSSTKRRGQWGQIELRRIVELAEMQNHVDFKEEASTEEGRPDMVIYLPKEGVLPVDSKISLEYYKQSLDSKDESVRREKLSQHAGAVRLQIQSLSKKSYWDECEKRYGKTPEFVVMFVPMESSMSAAFEQDPELLEYGLSRRVLIATPVTILALLKTVAYGWQQHQAADHARQILEQGRELHLRLIKFSEHLSGIGSGLEQAVNRYNDSIASYEKRLLPAAKEFKKLGSYSDETPAINPIESDLRKIKHVQPSENT